MHACRQWELFNYRMCFNLVGFFSVDFFDQVGKTRMLAIVTRASRCSIKLLLADSSAHACNKPLFWGAGRAKQVRATCAVHKVYSLKTMQIDSHLSACCWAGSALWAASQAWWFCSTLSLRAASSVGLQEMSPLSAHGPAAAPCCPQPSASAWAGTVCVARDGDARLTCNKKLSQNFFTVSLLC